MQTDLFTNCIFNHQTSLLIVGFHQHQSSFDLLFLKSSSFIFGIQFIACLHYSVKIKLYLHLFANQYYFLDILSRMAPADHLMVTDPQYIIIHPNFNL